MVNKILSVLLCVLVCSTNTLKVLSNSQEYHDDFENWPELCQTGQKQSPVNVESHKAIEEKFPPLVLKNYDIPFKTEVVNNGHTVRINIIQSEKIPSVEGGRLKHEYVLDHVHFHWSAEHTINGNRLPLEAHLVHYAKPYGSVKGALEHKDGIAVIATIFDIAACAADEFDAIGQTVLKVTEKLDSPVEVPVPVPITTFLPEDTKKYYTYDGSLTTPNCNEVVTWIIFAEVSFITNVQLSSLSHIYTKKGRLLTRNYRSLQKLNGRSIFVSV